MNLWGYEEGAARLRGLENVWLWVYNWHKVINTFMSLRLYPWTLKAPPVSLSMPYGLRSHINDFWGYHLPPISLQRLAFLCSKHCSCVTFHPHHYHPHLWLYTHMVPYLHLTPKPMPWHKRSGKPTSHAHASNHSTAQPSGACAPVFSATPGALPRFPG